MNIKPFLAVLLLASVLPTCASAAHYVVKIKDMAFGPAPAHLVVGDTIEWKNEDIFRHTATDRKGSFDLDLPPGAHAQVTLKTPGVLDVYCRFHPTMKIRLTVAKP
jgi:plastocyanin